MRSRNECGHPFLQTCLYAYYDVLATVYGMYCMYCTVQACPTITCWLRKQSMFLRFLLLPSSKENPSKERFSFHTHPGEEKTGCKKKKKLPQVPVEQKRLSLLPHLPCRTEESGGWRKVLRKVRPLIGEEEQREGEGEGVKCQAAG